MKEKETAAVVKKEEKVKEAWMLSINEVSERGDWEGSEIGSDFVDDYSKSTCWLFNSEGLTVTTSSNVMTEPCTRVRY